MGPQGVAAEAAPSARQGRRKGSNRKNNGNKGNNRKNNKNRRNQNKKKKGNKQKVESREDHGPIYPTPEERAASNAYLTGLPSLARIGDVNVDDTGRTIVVDVRVQVGPLFVQLADTARALTKSHVSTTLEADMQFKIRNKGRGRQSIKLSSLSMSGPTEVTVARLDLPLEAEVVSAAKDEVRQAVDVARLGRIFETKLETIFETDNVVQNLEHHELLQE
ncbi:hypothetical protein GWK47_005560 [Chionoecetes opilio]|uniref:Uncharacterized protein n=1 Tax=Chionoecetes opilio TaxID=41210 RepID=A0A8J5CYU9_CHIOP|nr:hypothetical protein GWK47_005560 [Chionoecetes opilio]